MRSPLPIPPPPLALYAHVPWCVQKCPYCDFNSHAQRAPLPERAFIDALLTDLEQDLPLAGPRALHSLFIGGGTPSLLSGPAIARLLDGIKQRIAWEPGMEITMEANPGSAEARRFEAYRAAGVNRLSLGIQSFDPRQLKTLGRVHDAVEAEAAAHMARAAGFDNFNLDLMFGLPGQQREQARDDVLRAIDLQPSHISYYQLTLEPNTLFHRQPPRLPDDDRICEIHAQGQALLAEAGYRLYEISAYAQAGRQCRHNRNYWLFGDYLGIGPGAHGKFTLRDGTVRRAWKTRHPTDYLSKAGRHSLVSGVRDLDEADLLIEFMMNALRLSEGFEADLFCRRTGLDAQRMEEGLQRARSLGLLRIDPSRIQPTTRGHDFLNELLALFAP